MTADRHQLRSSQRARRRSLGPDRLRDASRAMCERLLALPELGGPGRLATYLAADGELDPDPAHGELRARSWTLHLPVVGEQSSMGFVRWDEGALLSENRYGIAEPAVDEAHPELRAVNLDVVLLPCVAADVRGNRLGMGAGYYDRALANSADQPRPVRIVLAHDDAVLAMLPVEPWDVPADLVVTERRTIRP